VRRAPCGTFSLHLSENRTANVGVHSARAASQAGAGLLEFRFHKALGGGPVGLILGGLSRSARFHFVFGTEFMQAAKSVFVTFAVTFVTFVTFARGLLGSLGRGLAGMFGMTSFQTSVEGRVLGSRAVRAVLVREVSALCLDGLEDLGHGALLLVTRVRVVVGSWTAALVVLWCARLFCVRASAFSCCAETSLPR